MSSDLNHLSQRIEDWGYFREAFKNDPSNSVTVSFDIIEYSDNLKPVQLRLQYVSDTYVTGEEKTLPLAGDAQWKRVETTFNLPMNYEEMQKGAVPQVRFEIGSISDTSTNRQRFRIKNVKLELGSNATPFVPDDLQVNIAKCQRYYYRNSAEVGAFSPICMLQKFGTDDLLGCVSLPSRLRAAPVISFSGVDGFRLVDDTTAEISAISQYTNISLDLVSIQITTVDPIPDGFSSALLTFNGFDSWFEADSEI